MVVVVVVTGKKAKPTEKPPRGRGYSVIAVT